MIDRAPGLWNSLRTLKRATLAGASGSWNLLRNLKHTADRRFGNYSRLIQFCAVGTSGMAIDLGAYAILQRLFERTPIADWPVPGLAITQGIAAAGTLAMLLALTWNFNLNRRFTFNDARRRGSNIFRQFCTYALSNAPGIAVSLAFRFGLPSWSTFFRQHLHTAALIGIICSTGLSFSLARWLVFRRPESVASTMSPVT